MDPTFIIILLSLVAIVAMFSALLIQRKRYKTERLNVKKLPSSHILENMPLSFFVCDKDLNIVETHNIPANIEYALSPKGLKGMNVKNIQETANQNFKKVAGRIIENILKVAQIKENIEFVLNIEREGEKKQSFFNLVYDFRDGSIVGYIQTSSLSNEELEKQQLSGFVEKIIDDIPIGVYIKKPYSNGNLMYYNHYVKEIYFSDGIDYQQYFELTHSTAKAIKREDELVMMNDTPMTFERVFYDGNGNITRCCNVIKTKLKLHTFEEDVLIMCFMIDVTEKRSLEKKIEEENFKFEVLLKSFTIEQWDYNIVTHEFSYNIDNSKVKKKLMREDLLAIVYPDDKDAMAAFFDKMDAGKEETLTVEYRLKQTNSDEYKWIESSAVVLERDGNGSVIRYTGKQKDVTERGKINQELVELRDKADDSNRQKSAFLVNMSHEIRTPLNAIVGFSNLMSQTEDQKEKSEYYKIIKSNTDILLQLINDILDLSKIEAGYLDFNITEVNVSEIISNQVHVMSLRVQDGVGLISKIPLKSCYIRTDKNRLTQVITNFLTNACKFTSQGYIEVGFEQIPKGLRFYVTDTGKGISKENLPKVFGRFTKFDNLVSGNGLGLAISQTIIHRFNGEIGVESELGKGSTFWATIPCEVKTSATPSKQTRAAEPKAQTKPNEKQNMIVAEDNDSNYYLVYMLLEKEYNLTRAVNGKEVIELYEQHKPDIILMDIKMPVMDGYEATRIIRKKDKKIPIIALTANAFETDREKAMSAGCNAFMTKPIDADAFKQALQQMNL